MRGLDLALRNPDVLAEKRIDRGCACQLQTDQMGTTCRSDLDHPVAPTHCEVGTDQRFGGSAAMRRGAAHGERGE